jgi:hypothetical protein
MVVAFRKHALLSLDDGLYALQATISPFDVVILAPLPAMPSVRPGLHGIEHRLTKANLSIGVEL